MHQVYAETHELQPELEDDFQLLRHTAAGCVLACRGRGGKERRGPGFGSLGARAATSTTTMDGQEEALIAGRTPAGEGEAWGRDRSRRGEA